VGNIGDVGFGAVLRLFSEKSQVAVMGRGTSNAKAFYRLHPIPQQQQQHHMKEK
jgi:hypothetical protein